MQTEIFDPFSILGLEPGAAESEIKKKYRRLSVQYHPDKNPDPGWRCFSLIHVCYSCKLRSLQERGLSAITHVTDFFFILFISEAHKYFVEYIAKAYQALTDPIARENYEKYGHPDGRQVIKLKCYDKVISGVLPFCFTRWWNIHDILYFIAGISNGYSSPSIPAKHWWGIWWNTLALDCWCVHSLAIGCGCCLSLQIIKVYWQLCDASNTFHLLLLHEAFFGPQVCSLFIFVLIY